MSEQPLFFCAFICAPTAEAIGSGPPSRPSPKRGKGIPESSAEAIGLRNNRAIEQ